VAKEGVFERILITGAGGLLGGSMAELLKRQGRSFVALDHRSCDITQPGDLERAFERHRPTLVLNCAAHAKVDRCEREPKQARAVNAQAVGSLAELAARFGVFLVHFSTDFVFDGRADKPYRPDDLANPLSVYGRTKLEGERLLGRSRLDRWLIVRTSGLFGRHGACFVATILAKAKAGRTIHVVNDQVTQPTYADDLSDATLRLTGLGKTGVWHLANVGPTDWHNFALSILHEYGIKADLRAVTTERWRQMRKDQAIRPFRSVLDCATSFEALGLPMRTWHEAIKDYRTLS